MVSFEELIDGLPPIMNKLISSLKRLRSGDIEQEFSCKSLDTYGDVTYHDTYWADMRVPLTQTTLGALSKPDFDATNVGLLFPQNDATEIAYFVAQLPHEWKEGTTIFPHIHWRQSAATAVTWKLDYKIVGPGKAVPAGFTTVEGTDVVFPYTSGDLQQITALGAGIDMTGHGISSIVLGKLYRDDNTTTGDVLGYDIDFHYEIDSPGGREPFTK